MARPNYSYEKRQKELAKQKKKEEKRQRKLANRDSQSAEMVEQQEPAGDHPTTTAPSHD